MRLPTKIPTDAHLLRTAAEGPTTPNEIALIIGVNDMRRRKYVRDRLEALIHQGSLRLAPCWSPKGRRTHCAPVHILEVTR